MAKCMCGLIWQLGVMPMTEHEARAAVHRICPVCADRGENRVCWLADLPENNVLPFPTKERLQ